MNTVSNANGNAGTKKPATPSADPALQAIEDALASNNARLQSTQQKLEAGSAQVEKATSIISNSMEEITRSTQIVSAATQNAALTAQNNANAVLAASGGTEEQVAQMKRLKAEGDRVSSLLAQKADILDNEPTGLFIIDQIVNAWNVTPVQRDLKVAGEQYNATIGQIQNATAAQEGFAKINELNKKTINDATIAANSRQIAAEGAFKVAQIEIQNVQTNADMTSRILTADSRITDNLLAKYNLQGQIEQRAIQQERLAFEREQMTQQRDMWEKEKPRRAAELELLQNNLAETKYLAPAKRVATEAEYATKVRAYNEGLALEEQQVTSVQKAQSLAGLPIEPAETIKYKFANTGTREQYIKLQELGGTSNLQLGGDPYEAAATLRTVDPSGMAVSTKGTDLLNSIAREQIAAYTALEANAPKDAATFKTDFNTAAKAKMMAAKNNIVAGDTTNPYQAPPFSVLEGFAEVQNTALWQNVLAPLNMTTVDPQRILESASAGVAAKLVTPEQAATGIVTLFKSAALYNNTIEGGFERIGMAEFNQTSYNTVIKYRPTFYETLKSTSLIGIANPLLKATWTQVGNDVSKSEVINLMDATKVQQMIIKQLSNMKPSDASQAAQQTN
jgi:hypothetical protein